MQRWTFHREGQGRVFSAAVAVEHRHLVYCFRGCLAENLDWRGKKVYHIKAQAFHTESLCWEVPRGKCPFGFSCVCESSVCGSSACRCAQPFYGYGAVLIGDTCVYLLGAHPDTRKLLAFDVEDHSWSMRKVSGTIPKGKRDHSRACVLGKFIYTLRTKGTDDMYKLDTSTLVWTLINGIGTLPHPSWRYSTIIIGTKIFVLGGLQRSHGFYCNNISVFDTQKAGKKPRETGGWLSTPRVRQNILVCSCFAHNGELYSIGFSDSATLLQYCLWKFCPETFSWTKANLAKAKGPFSSARSHCCVVGDRVIFFGRNKPFDLHMLDLSPKAPSLKTLSKRAVLQYGLRRPALPHNVRWELEVMATTMMESGDDDGVSRRSDG